MHTLLTTIYICFPTHRITSARTCKEVVTLLLPGGDQLAGSQGVKGGFFHTCLNMYDIFF